MPGFLFLWRYHWHARTPKKKSSSDKFSRSGEMKNDCRYLWFTIWKPGYQKKRRRRRKEWPIFLESRTPPDRDLQHNAVWLLFNPSPHGPPLLCRMIERMTGRESPVIRSDFSNRRLICDRIYSSGEHVNRLPRNPPESSSERFHVQPQSL